MLILVLSRNFQFLVCDEGSWSSSLFFLSIDVAYSPHRYHLSQTKYLADILQRASIINLKIVNTSLEVNQKLFAFDGTLVFDLMCHQQVVGSLVYLTITRHDIAYPMQVFNQFDFATMHLNACIGYYSLHIALPSAYRNSSSSSLHS